MQGQEVSISLCMIVKNEEEVIARCLDSARNIADEIIVVDTGSTDHTKAIIRDYTDRCYDFVWIDDFSTARNFSFSQATKDYILWLDADDVILESSMDKFLFLKHNLTTDIDSVILPYHYDHDQHGNVTLSLHLNRLVKRSNNFQWIGCIHEYLEVSGHIVLRDIPVSHFRTRPDSDRNLQIFNGIIGRGQSLTSRDLYYYASELLVNGRYDEAIAYFHKFLSSGQGWLEDNISACGKMADCYLALNDTENSLRYIYKSFDYDRPRPDFCCRLGDHFLRNEQLPQAIFWYKLATELKQPIISWGVVNHPYWTWLPHLQLCLCYDKIGHYALAHKHNEIAAGYIPADERVLCNRRRLKGILAIQGHNAYLIDHSNHETS